jgi:hypothetical protein
MSLFGHSMVRPFFWGGGGGLKRVGYKRLLLLVPLDERLSCPEGVEFIELDRVNFCNT